MSGSGLTIPATWAAACELGAVYRGLIRQGDVPLDSWAIPKRRENTPSRLMLGISQAYGSANWENLGRYKEAYDLVIPQLRGATVRMAGPTLAKQASELADLVGEFVSGDLPDRLHKVVAAAGKAAAGYDYSDADLREAYAKYGQPNSSWSASRLYELNKWIEARKQERIASAFSEMLRTMPSLDPREEAANQRVTRLAKLIFAHPWRLAILRAYDKSAAAGTELTLWLIGEALRATNEFANDLRTNADHVWRYAPLVMLGVQELGLHEVDGFPEYAVDIGRVLDPRLMIEKALTALGLVVVCVGVVFTGPLGVAALGVIDLALTGASGALAYMREREQDMAAVGSGFRAAGRLAERSDYSETKMAGVAALLSALALLGPGAELLRKVKARSPGTPPARRSIELAPRSTRPVTLTDKELEQALQRSNAVPELTKTSITRNRAVGKGTRVGSPSEAISPRRMADRAREVGEEPLQLGLGTPREFEPAGLEKARGLDGKLSVPPPRIDPLDYNMIPEEALVGPQAPIKAAPLRTEPLNEAALTRAGSSSGAPNLSELERANAPGRRVAPRTDRTIVTRQEQLYGLELEWEAKLRGNTPTPEMRAWAQDSLRVGDPDPIVPTLKVDAATADHIVAVELIRQFPGFAQLSTEAKLAVLNLPKNFMPVSRLVNQARGSTPYAKLTHILGHSIPPPILASMQARELAAAGLIQQRINELLRAETAMRGVAAPFMAARAPSLTGLWRLIGGPEPPDDKEKPKRDR
jgi:hypothetical protein